MTASSGNRRLTTLLRCAHAGTIVLTVVSHCILEHFELGKKLFTPFYTPQIAASFVTDAKTFSNNLYRTAPTYRAGRTTIVS